MKMYLVTIDTTYCCSLATDIQLVGIFTTKEKAIEKIREIQNKIREIQNEIRSTDIYASFDDNLENYFSVNEVEVDTTYSTTFQTDYGVGFTIDEDAKKIIDLGSYYE